MSTYNRLNPYHAAMTEKVNLCSGPVDKQTYHCVLNIAGSDLSYGVGDSIGIYPENDPLLVDKVLKAIRADGATPVSWRGAAPQPLEEALRRRVNLSDVTKKLIELVAAASGGGTLAAVLAAEGRDALKAFTGEREVWDFLEECCSAPLAPQPFLDSLLPQMPRFYSIASHEPSTPGEVHLTVAVTHYQTRGIERWGVCSHYLCHLAPMQQATVPIFVQPTKSFTLPDDGDADIIMIGPGTGVAPYRGFMQMRRWRGDRGRNWLFFGEWHRDHTFFYRDFWEELVQAGHLRLDAAFSRDQEYKVYVQHHLWEQRAELLRWLDGGAYLYLCGDAHRMARDVEETLAQVYAEGRGVSHEEGKAILKQLHKEGRYRKDVY